MVNWSLQRIRNELHEYLDKIQVVDSTAPYDHAGGRIPILLALLGAAESFANGSFYGSIEIQVKGNSAMNPRVVAKTSHMGSTHTHLLEQG